MGPCSLMNYQVPISWTLKSLLDDWQHLVQLEIQRCHQSWSRPALQSPLIQFYIFNSLLRATMIQTDEADKIFNTRTSGHQHLCLIEWVSFRPSFLSAPHEPSVTQSPSQSVSQSVRSVIFHLYLFSLILLTRQENNKYPFATSLNSKYQSVCLIISAD